MRWRLDIRQSIQRNIFQLPWSVQEDIREILQELKDDPRPPDSKELQRELKGTFTIRISETWRLIYSVNEADRVVRIISIEERGANTYLNLGS